MKFFNSILLIVACLTPSLSTGTEDSSNYPLFALKNVMAYEVSQDLQYLFTIEATETGTKFVKREMSSSAVSLDKAIELPEAYLLNTVLFEDNMYLFAAEIIDRKNRVMETSVYEISCTDGHADIIYQSREMLGFAEKFYVTKNGLLLTEKRGNNPYFFSLTSNKMTAIDLPDDFRIRSFDYDRNCATIIKQSNFSTDSASRDGIQSYKEGDGSPLDVYICDFTENFALSKVGQYQPSYTISENAEESSLPHFIMETNSYDWVVPSFMVNRFPLFPGNLIGYPKLMSLWESLDEYPSITEITFVGEKYVLGVQFSYGEDSILAVYYLENPRLEKEETVSQADRNGIKELFTKDTVVEKRVLESSALADVFAAKFYEINLVTTTVDSTSEWGVSSMSSTESFLAVAMDDDYAVFKRSEQLKEYLVDGFVLDEGSALVFQEALDVLFPMSHFEEKHKEFFKQGDTWIFVRNESFGDKSGIAVGVDGEGGVVSILPKDGILVE